MEVECRVCGKLFIKTKNLQCCSTKCSSILAKLTNKSKAKIEYCKMCMKPYKKTTVSVCCSDACRLENKRQSRRRSWQRHKPDRYDEWLRLRLWRIRHRISRVASGTNNI